MVAAYMKGEVEPPLKMLQYIAENGGDVNWILTGKRRGGECVGGGDNPTLRVAMANWNDMEDADQVATSAEVQAKAERARAKKADDAKGGAAPLLATLALFFCLLNVFAPFTAWLTSLLLTCDFAVAGDTLTAVGCLAAVPAIPLTCADLWRRRRGAPAAPRNVVWVDFRPGRL